jgi:uncharacterized protein (TIGR02117 family)
MWRMRLRGGPLPLALAIALIAEAPPLGAEPPPVSVFVVTHHWHTGIAMRVADVPPGRWPDAELFAGAQFVEVGWGDRDFWMAPRETIGLALKAAVASEASVLRLLWFDGPVERALPASDIVELPVSPAGLAALVEFIAESYARTPQGQPIDLGPGPLPGSRFYLATGRYHLFHTSNRWTAEALRRAGLPFSLSSLTAGSIMDQAAQMGRVIRLRECGVQPSPAPPREAP